MPNVLPLDNVNLKIGGGKAYALSKITSNFEVPKGFVITTEVYDYYLKHKKLPETLKEEIREIINYLGMNYPLIARSSATIEDSMYHSFAGQFISIFPINNLEELLNSIIKIYQSVNSEKVRRYVRLLNIETPLKMAVLVQEFINTDYGGVAFSKNIFENKDEIVIEISEGLPEYVVSGKAKSNIYFVNKHNLGITRRTENFTLDSLLIKDIARAIKKLEDIFGYPIDVEFGIKGNKLYIFQVRPITPKKRRVYEFKVPRTWAYIEGLPTGTGKVFGIARIIEDKRDLSRLKPGEIIVSKTTYNDWMPDMLKAIGIVNEIGNITSHAAIIAREFGIPAVINARGCLKLIKDGMPIFVDADEGKVYYPGKEVIKLLDFLSDFILDLTPLNINTLKPVNMIDVIKDPKKVVLYEEYLGYKIVYFHHSLDEKVKQRILDSLSAIEGHPDVHWNFVEWAYGFLIHEGLKEWFEKSKNLLDTPRDLDIYLYRTMKLARKAIKDAYEVYREAKDKNSLELYIKVLSLVDLSSKYFGIANTIIPLGYGLRKLRELAMQYNDYRIVLSQIEGYKGTKLYELYRVLEKWKDLSNEMDVWDARTQLWNAVRRRLKENFGFDPNEFIKDGTGYYFDMFLWNKFGVRPKYYKFINFNH